jgi:nucleoid DNA-binding protein
MVGKADGRREALTTAALVLQVAQETRLTHQQTAAIVELFLEGIIEALSTGDTGELHGCGRCRCGQRWARQGRHPTTGVPVEVLAHMVPVYPGGKLSTSGCTLG